MFCSFFTDRCGRKPSGFAGQRTVWPRNLLPVSCPPKCPPSCPLKCQLYVQQLESLLSFFDLGNESLSHGTFAMQHFHALLIGVPVGVSQGHLCAVVLCTVTRTAAFGQLFSAQPCFSELSLGESVTVNLTPAAYLVDIPATSLQMHHTMFCFFFQ